MCSLSHSSSLRTLKEKSSTSFATISLTSRRSATIHGAEPYGYFVRGAMFGDIKTTRRSGGVDVAWLPKTGLIAA